MKGTSKETYSGIHVLYIIHVDLDSLCFNTDHLISLYITVADATTNMHKRCQCMEKSHNSEHLINSNIF